MVTLSSEQQEAFDRACEFAETPHPRSPYFSIDGNAGTGKTVILAELAKKYPNAPVITYTAKAASVLRRRGIHRAMTAHSLIYDYLGNHEDEFTGEMKPIFRNKDGELGQTLVLLDEKSMVGERVANDLLSKGVKVITTGDPGQLQPVGDKQYFVRADVLLKTIHRQALESPIIRQAHAVRNSGDYADDGPDFHVIQRSDAAMRQSVDIALCYRNRTRQVYNSTRRGEAGMPKRRIQAGEPTMCLRNDHRRQIWNGVIYTVHSDWVQGEPLVLREELTDRVVVVDQPTVEDFSPEFLNERNDGDFSPFALAYCVTCHKYQGSESPSVLFIDEHPRNEMWKFFAYTAITRAAERIIVVRK